MAIPIRPIARLVCFAAAALLPPLLSGCGGGAHSAGSHAGSLTLKVLWPAPSKLIPAASNSIKASLSGTSAPAPQILARPVTGNTASVTFTDLQPGSVTLTATAFPNADGTGTAQATGSAPATIVAGQTATVTVTMASTIDHVNVTPNPASVQVGQTVQLTATPVDTAGNVVLVSPSNLAWTTGAAANATLTPATGATTTVTGVAATTTPVTITATESESGKSGTSAVTVTAVAVNPFKTPQKVVITPSGRFAYVVNEAGLSFNAPGYITQHRVNADGTLTELTTSTLPITTHASDMAVDKTGSFAYVTDFGDTNDPGRVYQFRVNADGTLSALNPATVPPGQGHPNGIYIEPTNKYLYVANGDGEVAPFRINADGTLTKIGTGPQAGIPALIISDPAGKYLYVSGQTGTSEFSINADGSLTKIGSDATRMFGLAVDPSGQTLYGAGYNGTQLFLFKINADGTLTPLSPASVPTGQASQGVAVTPNGQFVYVSDDTTFTAPGNIWQFKRNADGSVSALAPHTVPTQNSPNLLTVDPAGTFLYVPAARSDTVQVFRINADGTLTPVQ